MLLITGQHHKSINSCIYIYKKEIGNILDHFTRIMVIVMIIMATFVLFKIKQPVMFIKEIIIRSSGINFMTSIIIAGRIIMVTNILKD
jgi:hypothetical protein